MSHVTDGELHALLDGALGDADPQVAARVEEHLASCGDCRSRLEAARALRERAGELLATTLPGADAIPTFEEIQRRTPRTSARPRDGTGRATRRGPLSLAWAASIAIAVTAGWAVRDSWPGPSPERFGNEADVVLAESEVADELALRESAADPDSEGRRARVAEAQTGANAADAVAADDENVGDLRAELAPAQTAELDVANEPRRQEAETPNRADESVARGAGEPVPTLPSAEKASAVATPHDLADPSQQLRKVAGPVWIRASEIDAARWLGREPVRIPGLEVGRIEITEIDGVHAVRIESVLPAGEPLWLILRPPSPVGGADAKEVSGLASEGAVAFDRRLTEADAGTASATRQLDGLAVTLIGRVAPDSLAILLSRIR